MYHSVSQTINKTVSVTYACCSSPTAEGVLNDNYFLMNATATNGAYTITANQNGYVLRITTDGNLVVTNAGESSEVGIDALITIQ